MRRLTGVFALALLLNLAAPLFVWCLDSAAPHLAALVHHDHPAEQPGGPTHEHAEPGHGAGHGHHADFSEAAGTAQGWQQLGAILADAPTSHAASWRVCPDELLGRHDPHPPDASPGFHAGTGDERIAGDHARLLI